MVFRVLKPRFRALMTTSYRTLNRCEFNTRVFTNFFKYQQSMITTTTVRGRYQLY